MHPPFRGADTDGARMHDLNEDMNVMEGAAFLKDAADLLPKAWDIAKQYYKVVGDRASYDFRIAHTKYCVKVVEQFCRARTFFVRDEPRFLDEFYVPASIIKRGKVRVPRAGLSDLSGVGRRAIVTGSGGAGKTMFMRHLLLDAIQTGDKYPVFIELRRLNEADEIDLESIISEFMEDHGFPLGKDFALKSLNEGLLVILFDGFDEVVAEKRKKIEKEIRKLGARSASQIIVSSRQDSHLDGWDNFSTVSIAPLELSEACDLIEKIPFAGEEDVKERFVKKLKQGLFKSHEYFLSNPLLLSIMLLTYGDYADIPTKFSSFYEQAYIALYHKHDALKAGYKRERKVPLDLLDFSRLFATFSAITYDKRAFRFTHSEAIAYAETAKKLTGLVSVSAEGFIEDAQQAVCLLVEDGLDYAFVHRSFQEYFVARFISEANEETKKGFIAKIAEFQAKSYQGDGVLQLLFEMNPSLVEEMYLLPEMRNLFGRARHRKITKTVWKSLFPKVVSSMRIVDNSTAVVFSIKGSSRAFNAVAFLKNNFEVKRSSSSVVADRDLHQVLLSHFSPETSGEVQLRDVPVRAPLWDAIMEHVFTFSMSEAEGVRQEVLKMEGRHKERLAASKEIFKF